MEKDDPTIGLYGIWGVYNYGCEAIVRGTEIILHEIWPDAHIKYVSPRPEDDKNRLKGCNIEIVPRKFHNLLSISRLNSIIGQKTGFYSKKFFHEDLGWVDDCDMIFSIGGDLYTLPPNYKDPKKRYYNPLIHFGELVKSRGKKLVIWGASIGPFEGYPKAKKVFSDHLSQADLITSREPVTTRYLKSLGIKNVIECADPAFAIPKPDHINKKKLNQNKLYIGINLSPLSSSYSFNLDMKKVIKSQADLITTLIKKYSAHVTLIPHVVCDFNEKDDDLRYLKLIKSFIEKDFVDQVEVVESDPGFIGTKEILSNCDVVIAARMHCAINAVALDVPTIFLAYSKKAEGMVKYVYGNDKWTIPLKELKNNDIMELISHILNEKGLFKRLNKNNKISPSVLESIIKK
jgi:colanic acid/amylovoran biosynthesis protein